MRSTTRRAVLGAGLAAAGSGLVAGCSGGSRIAGSTGATVKATDRAGGADQSDHGGRAVHGDQPAPSGYVSPHGSDVAAAEARRKPGPERKFRLTATETPLDLGARTVRSWAYGDRLPGGEIRITAGDTLAVTFANHLREPTSVHWHGVELRNDMDGVPDLTQDPVKPGASFDYRFAIPHPGTYWFHPHMGGQQDRGLYAPLIVEDPKEPLAYDKEWVVVLDDWLDGVKGSTPDTALRDLTRGMRRPRDHGGMDHGGTDRGRADQGGTDQGPSARGHAGSAGPSRMLKGGKSDLLGGDAGDVDYPYYLVNGRTADSPAHFEASPGDRVRIRFVNAGGDTAFRVALGGHTMTVTHTDGSPVEHASTDALLLGMGERYDVLVTAGDGVFPLVALAEGKKHTGMAVLRTGSGAAPAASVRPAELSGRLITAHRMKAGASARLRPRTPDRTVELRLTGSMAAYDWAFNGEPYDPSQRYPLRAGERVRLVFTNRTRMWHPVHLHGHRFALGAGGPLKDTAIVLPRETVTVDFDADNPGLWMAHCHNVYHAQAGMMTVLGYRA